MVSTSLTLKSDTLAREIAALRLPSERLRHARASTVAPFALYTCKTWEKHKVRTCHCEECNDAAIYDSRKRDCNLRLPACRLGNGLASNPASLASVAVRLWKAIIKQRHSERSEESSYNKRLSQERLRLHNLDSDQIEEPLPEKRYSRKRD